MTSPVLDIFSSTAEAVKKTESAIEERTSLTAYKACTYVGYLECVQLARIRESAARLKKSHANLTTALAVVCPTVSLSRLRAAIQKVTDRFDEPFSYPASPTLADVIARIDQIQAGATGEHISRLTAIWVT